MLKALCLFLVFYSQASFPCEKAINFQVGPFFSSTLINQYWKGFTDELSIQTSCKVNILPPGGYEQYLDTLLAGQGDLFLVPNHYVQALTSKGLTPALISARVAQIRILSRHDINSNNARALIGDTILVASRYTQAFLELENWLKQKGLQGKVNFSFNHSHA